MCAMTFDSSVMKRMIESALDLAPKVEFSTVEQTVAALQRGDCAVCERVRYGLAQRIAEYLGSVDTSLKAVYVYEPEYAVAGDGAGPESSAMSPGIHMIAWAGRKSAALASVVNMLGSSLAEESKAVACPKANALCYALAVQVVDDDEVLGRTGYGALVNSLYVRPIQLWRRDAVVA
jgi:hypothetical protein